MEYGLLLGAIAAAIVLVIYVFGQIVTDQYDTACDKIKSGGTSAGTADGTC